MSKQQSRAKMPLARVKRGRPRGKGTQLVYQQLREEILQLALQPGDHIDEVALEAKFDVSRTPIREALIRLQADGLVRFTPNRGHYVSGVDFAQIPLAFEALDVLQSAILQTAAISRTDSDLEQMTQSNEAYRRAAIAGDHTAMTEANHAFHLITAAASTNGFLRDPYESVLNFNLRLTRMVFDADSRDPAASEIYYHRIFDEHAEMIDRLRAGDVQSLIELSRRHTGLFYDKIQRFLQSNRAIQTRILSFKSLA